MSKHKYSTMFLIFALTVIGLVILVSGIDSSELDELCSINDTILYRYAGTWGCAMLTDVVTWYNITTVNNVTVLNYTILNATYPAYFYENVSIYADLNVTGNITGRFRPFDSDQTWYVEEHDSDLHFHFDDLGGSNYVGWSTTGAYMQLYANPNPSNGYLLWNVAETQGADTFINIYEGGTTHNRFWSSGSVRIGGDESYLCSNMTTDVDCDTPLTGADLVVEDDIWSGGKIFASDWTNASINCSQIYGSPDGDFCTDATGGAGSGSQWNISTSQYLYNNSGILEVNETKLNETISNNLGNTTSWWTKSGDTIFAVYDAYINKSNPEMRLIDSANDRHTRIIRNNTDNIMQIFNMVAEPASDPYALDFDGNNDELEANTNWADPTNITVSMWIKPDDLASNRRLLSWVETGSAYLVFRAEAGKLQLLWSDGSGSEAHITNSVVLSSGSWQHVAYTLQGDNPPTFYVNASSKASTQSGGDLRNLASSVFTVGSDAGGKFDGQIDEVAVWSEVLSANDITDLYNSGTGLYIDPSNDWPTDGGSVGSNLELVYHFEEGVDLAVEDSSTNDRNATLENMDNDDWVSGKIQTPTNDPTEVSLIKSEDGDLAGEKGIMTINHDEGKTIILGSTIGVGQTNPTAKVDILGDTANQVTQLITMAPSQTQDAIRVNNNSGTEIFSVDSDGHLQATDGHFSGYIDGGFTAGSVMFADSSGITEDNSNLFWKNSTNRLGIGTTTPDGVLHIKGDTHSEVVLKVQAGSATMSANVLEIQESGGNTRAYFDDNNFGNNMGLTIDNELIPTLRVDQYGGVNDGTGGALLFGHEGTDYWQFYSPAIDKGFGALLREPTFKWGFYSDSEAKVRIGRDNVLPPNITAQFEAFSQNASRVATKIKGYTAQTADILQVVDINDDELFIIDSDGDIEIPKDGKKIYLGSGNNASITYDNDLVINPAEVGNGEVIINGSMQIIGDNGSWIGLYVKANISADDYLYHSPYPNENYTGFDALDDILNITGDGDINHSSVPDNTRSTLNKPIYSYETVEINTTYEIPVKVNHTTQSCVYTEINNSGLYEHVCTEGNTILIDKVDCVNETITTYNEISEGVYEQENSTYEKCENVMQNITITEYKQVKTLIGYEEEEQTSMGMMMGNIIKGLQADWNTAKPTVIDENTTSLKGEIAEFNEYATNTHYDTATMDRLASIKTTVDGMSFNDISSLVLQQGRLSDTVIDGLNLKGKTGTYNIEKASHYGVAGAIMCEWEITNLEEDIALRDECIINSNTLQEIKDCIGGLS